MAVEVMEMAGGSNDRRHEMIQRTQEVVPLTLDLVKEFLEEKDLKYLVDEDGDLVLIFKTPYPQNLFAHFVLGKLQEGILQILIRVAPSPPIEETEALKLVNTWNSTKRWPKAFYRDGDFYLEWSEDWETGVTPAILAHTCDRVLVGAHLFLGELNMGTLLNIFETFKKVIKSEDSEEDPEKETN